MSLVLKNVTKKYGESTALDSVDLEIKDGEFIAILGPSGCGKTTLLRIIAGFLEHTAGEVLYNDEVYSSTEKFVPVNQRNLSMVFQTFALWPHMTVREHIEYPLKSKRFKNLSETQREKMVNNAMACTGLKVFEDRYPGELSGGQKQRVSLARAIVVKPALLLMDEPLSALDADLKIAMRKEIKDIHNLTKATIIYVTHDQSEALAMADRIIIMKDGKIEQIGTPKEIYEKPQTIFTSTFVSKCNLVRGRYYDEKFITSNDHDSYPVQNMPSCFRENGFYPIRPEEFLISQEKGGLSGKIVNKQYNGREIHYKIQCEEDIFTVYSSDAIEYTVDSEVYLKKKVV